MKANSHIVTLSNVKQVSERISKLCGLNQNEVYLFLICKIQQNG